MGVQPDEAASVSSWLDTLLRELSYPLEASLRILRGRRLVFMSSMRRPQNGSEDIHKV